MSETIIWHCRACEHQFANQEFVANVVCPNCGSAWLSTDIAFRFTPLAAVSVSRGNPAAAATPGDTDA